MTRLVPMTLAAIFAGLALAASLFGAQRIATALIVLVILILATSVEALRHNSKTWKDPK